jgi:hypothetical protein
MTTGPHTSASIGRNAAASSPSAQQITRRIPTCSSPTDRLELGSAPRNRAGLVTYSSSERGDCGVLTTPSPHPRELHNRGDDQCAPQHRHRPGEYGGRHSCDLRLVFDYKSGIRVALVNENANSSTGKLLHVTYTVITVNNGALSPIGDRVGVPRAIADFLVTFWARHRLT